MPGATARKLPSLLGFARDRIKEVLDALDFMAGDFSGGPPVHQAEKLLSGRNLAIRLINDIPALTRATFWVVVTND